MVNSNSIAKLALVLISTITAACAPQTQQASESPGAAPKIPAPVITSPVSAVYYSTSSTLEVQGQCLEGQTVEIEGTLTEDKLNPPYAKLSTTCLNGRFYLRLETLSEGVHLLRFKQTGEEGLTAEESLLQWEYDNI